MEIGKDVSGPLVILIVEDADWIDKIMEMVRNGRQPPSRLR